MNKKLAMIGAGVVAGSVLLVSSVYAGIGKAPGYEAFKSAVKNTVAIENVTHRASLSIVDNGKMLIEANSTMKTGDGSRSSVDLTVQSGDEKQRIQVYGQEGTTVVKTSGSDVYRIIEKSGEKRDWRESKEGFGQHDPAFAQEAEKVLDALVGNLKNEVILQDQGDGKEISLRLEGSRIPTLVNAIGSLLIRESGRDRGGLPASTPADTFGVDLLSLKDSLPKLAQDIRIEAVNLDADVNADNRFSKQEAEIRVSGKDAQGASHDVVVKLGAGFSDYGSTVADVVDLTGKKTETVKPLSEDFGRWHKK
ncbi:hypothetical protein [Cohnella terricola]|uniref:Uncharacterized protein n=1 Tax=Cohnella terricola TaxID=1289167 RepID=A0A559JMY3_9BACL|nr:hypothetical protein [Cohnella terricola]TVY01237.1 hypothetical protein FPZ45_08805 [Cohnella terricola]